ncbi:MAG: aminodeoxychorismate/anthranilate synthase component II [Crocinitomicaceae bacterium]|nr:aminodeoxychorismate/anthranilate synthase component II [Crocinitomicaceae bacterium]
MLRLLLLDNYDSFTYNLKHYLDALDVEVDTYRNDAEFNIDAFDAVILSPGPGLPKDAGKLMKVIQQVDGKIPVFGICLGMQALAEHLGGELYNQKLVKHGVQESINLGVSPLYNGLPETMEVGLYHSWAIHESDAYTVNARSDDGVIMGIENPKRLMYGVQFHPESIMTSNGQEVLSNFLRIVRENKVVA